jgi:hypothetical protein
MSINTSLLSTEWFTFREIPEWPCPSCHKGTLTGTKKSFRLIQSSASKRQEIEFGNQSGYRLDYGNFAGVLRCSRDSCQEPVFLVGAYQVEDDFIGYDEYDHPDVRITEFLTPTIFQPTVPLFRLHHEVPALIRDAFDKSFEQFWLDNDACGNKLRSVVELLMTDQGMKSNRPLARRIEEFQTTKSNVLGDMLMAVKWIGNSGSHHGDSLSRPAIVDAMEMLDHVTFKLYDTESDKKEQRIHTRSQTINQAKGVLGTASKNPLPPPPPAAISPAN